jgi:hypothetical protein
MHDVALRTVKLTIQPQPLAVQICQQIFAYFVTIAGRRLEIFSIWDLHPSAAVFDQICALSTISNSNLDTTTQSTSFKMLLVMIEESRRCADSRCAVLCEDERHGTRAGESSTPEHRAASVNRNRSNDQ